MRRGLFVAPFDDLADPLLLADLAVEAERAGWDGFFLWDHMAYEPPVAAIADPWICLAAVAVRTTRILIGPMVTPLPRRRPHVVARQAAALALLSRGRLVLGFGIGDDGAGEFSGFGDEPDPRVRGRMLDEGLQVLTGLLSGTRLDHRGEHYTALGAHFLPAPPHRVPIWIAGRHPNRAPRERAERYDGFFRSGCGPPSSSLRFARRSPGPRRRPCPRRGCGTVGGRRSGLGPHPDRARSSGPRGDPGTHQRRAVSGPTSGSPLPGGEHPLRVAPRRAR